MTQYNIILSVHTEKQEIKVKLSKILQIDYSLVINYYLLLLITITYYTTITSLRTLMTK